MRGASELSHTLTYVPISLLQVKDGRQAKPDVKSLVRCHLNFGHLTLLAT